MSNPSGQRRLLSPRTIAAIVVLVLLVIAAAAVLSQTMVTQSDSNNKITRQWLDQAVARWRPSQNRSVIFGVLFSRASYGNPQKSYNPIPVQDADLHLLQSTNAQCFRMDVGYAPWLQNDTTAINDITGLVRDIKQQGKCLVIADAASESYRGTGAIPWTQFQHAWVQRVKTLASIYQPDYYIVIKEPGWYVPMVSDARTNPAFTTLTDWVNLTQTLTSTVLSASPATKVGISVAADSLAKDPQEYVPYLQSVEKMQGVSFLGFDIYDPLGFTATQEFLTQHGAGGKDVWIAEAWSGTAPAVVFDSSRAELDAEWLRVLYYFAQEVNAKVVVLFYTDVLSSYSLTPTTPTNPTQIISLYSQRTPVFYELQKLIAAGSAT